MKPVSLTPPNLDYVPNRPSGWRKAFEGALEKALGMIGGGSNLLGISSEYRDLLMLQMQMNDQAQRVNLESNLEKTRHDMKMAAIRNIRMN